MSDEIDRAQAHEEELRADALAAHARKTAVMQESAKFCEEPSCGQRIPAARRKAVPGVRFCIECQGLREKMKGRHASSN